MSKRFVPILALVGLCWVVFFANNLLWGGRLAQYGIVPRHLGGLPGIIWSPFLHGSLQHLVANTVPLLLLGGILCARSRSEFVEVIAGGVILGGGLTWLIGRSASHIGASGLVFCMFGYLASQALFNFNLGSLCLSILCMVGYGGMLRGILPTSGAISWEAHLAGLLAGIALAWLNSKEKKSAGKAEAESSNKSLLSGP